MRIIVWGINYAPELTGIAPFNTGLCDYLLEQGHQVEMVTTFPYYPWWKKIPGDRGRMYRTDEIDGVWVHRCWHYVPARATTLKRMWHELSFGLTSLLRVLFLARADVYVIVSPPLLLGPLASFVGWLKRRRYVFHVQDLQPDAAVGLGMVKVGALTKLLYRVEAWSYRHAAFVSGISGGMLAAYERKGVPAEKRVLFPNWIRWFGRNTELALSDAQRRNRAAAFRQKFGIPENAFLASYSGNLGRKQGLETLVEAAQQLRERFEEATGHRRQVSGGGPAIENRQSKIENDRPREIIFLVVGDGVMRRELEAQIFGLGLTNVRLLPLLIENDYVGMLVASDVSLILQARGTGQYFFPSKLLSVLSAGSPVVSVADDDSELAKAITEGGFGVNVPPANPDALARALERLAVRPEALAALRRKTEWVKHFSGPRVLGDFDHRLRELVIAQ